MRRRNLSKGKINKNFNKNYNSRIVVLFCILTIIVLLIVGKLIYLQLTPAGDKYRKLSAKQSTNTINIDAERGKILDTNGETLADNVVSNNLYVNATYPNKEMLAQVLGFTNVNNDGVVGLESFYNAKLKGKPGKRILNSSVNRSIDLSDDSSVIINPENGYDLKTTIDSTIQGFVEDSLKDIENNFKPKSATIIVMNPNNGDVLGMGSFPNFNPNDPKTPLLKDQINELNDLKKENDEDKISKFYFNMWENKATSWTYEPGSVFKTITSAAATEEHTATQESHYFCNGFIRDIPGVVIRCERYWKLLTILAILHM